MNPPPEILSPATPAIAVQALSLTNSIQYPVLKKLGTQSIRKFLKDRAAYLREIAERTMQDGTVVGRAVSLQFSVDPSLLESLVDLRQLGEEIDTISKVTDESVQSWLDEHCELKKDTLSLSSVKTIIGKQLRINMAEKDTEQRVVILFADYTSLLRANGITWIIKQNPKVAVGHIVDALAPKMLQKRVREDLEFSHCELKKDFLAFMQHVIKRAEAYSEVVDVEISINGNKAADSTRSPTKQTATRSGTKDLQSESGKMSSSGNHTLGNKQKDLPPCLNPSCNLKHYLKECKNTDQALKDQLYAERARHRKDNGEQRTTRADVSQVVARTARGVPGASQNPSAKSLRSATVQEGRVSVSFYDGQDCIALPDLGADDNVVPQSLIRELEILGMFVPVRTLQEPITVGLAVQGPGISVQVTRQVQLTVQLKLPAGPLRLRNVRWLVSDNAMEEVLIGRPLLKALGMDAEMHLSAVRDEFQDMDCAAVATTETGGQLSRLMVRAASPDTPVKPTRTELNTVQPLTEDGYDPCQVRHGDVDVDPVTIPQLLDLPQANEASEVDMAIDQMLTSAAEAGMTLQGLGELTNLVKEFRPIWRISLGAGAPADLPPLQIRLKKEAKPVRVKLRRYPEAQAVFLRKFVGELIATGLAYRNPTATWCSAPLLVPKSGRDQFRFTVDLRPVNQQTVPVVWPMPHIESELSKLNSSRCFATFDLSHCYWQLPLAPDSQECQSFITPEGVFTPTRVLHGTCNAVPHMQAVLQETFSSLLDHLLAWLDDLLLHSSTEVDLLQTLREFFTICLAKNIKLHPDKCCLFALTLRWCGRLISAEGVNFDPRRVQGLRDMPPPQTGADLQQFVCALNWMRTAIPMFSTLIAPLQDLLEHVYAYAGSKRTRTAAAKVLLSDVGWDASHSAVFQACQTALINSVTLAHLSPDQRVCLYTDASNDFWSAIITQVPPTDLDLSPCDQRHAPLAFLSGKFTGPMKRWPIIEKEAYAILTSCERMAWLLQRPEGFSLYTDHRNLVYVFNPYGAPSHLSAHTAAKLIRWALKLSAYRYTIEFVPGSDNVWSDMLTRWASPPQSARLSALFLAPIAPTLDAEFHWPTAEEIRLLQTAEYELLCSPSSSPTSDFPVAQLTPLASGILGTGENVVWIPAAAAGMQLRICIVAHTSMGGHRGLKTTTNTIREHFEWKTMLADIKTFCNTCLHCLSTIGGDRVPRPFGEALHADRPNDVLHMDFLFMGSSTTGATYVLVLKDDLSSYVWLIPCQRADAASVVDALVLWFAAFGVAYTWVSDRGSHFKNKVMDGVRQALRSQHHYTTAYCPWANGTVERACKEVLRATRALLSEFRLQPNQWPEVCPVVQSALNHSPSSQRGQIAPITIFTGQAAESPLRSIFITGEAATRSLSDIQLQQALSIEHLRAAVDGIHKEATDASSVRRAAARKRRTEHSGVQPPNFEVGDFVLVSKRTFHTNEKLTLRWRGPRRVVGTLSDYVFEVQDLETEQVASVHASRLRYYHDPSLNITVDLLAHIAHNEQGYVIKEITDIRHDARTQDLFVLVYWLGFEDEDASWEPIEIIHEDAPEQLAAFLDISSNIDLVARARQILK
jgi:RNase H-like domain found in reverse transcriptase/Reverse transcriptase (RNA-dependent DNA polymerase)/Integrase core domain/Integrase zinc binding domain/Chromo (CHRromatin Organisation MOdifier) domain